MADDEDRFVAIVLGAGGGPDESDLSAHLLGRRGGEGLVCLDAGTVFAGIERAVRLGRLDDYRPPAGVRTTHAAWVLRHHVKAYLISHPHLDHVAGLVTTSPIDEPKPILGLDPTIDALRDHLFNGTIWPNFADEGREPRLRRYRYVRAEPARPIEVEGTGLTVRAHRLAHAATTSTAFLVGDETASVLYLGDTGPDAVEESEALRDLWAAVAPLVRSGRLRAIFLEASYPDPRPEDRLYGHLTPDWIRIEMERLATSVDPDRPATALAGLRLLVTHVKPDPIGGGDPKAEIEAQLAPLTRLGVKPILLEAGQRLEF